MTIEELEIKLAEAQKTNQSLVDTIGKMELANKEINEDRQLLKDKIKSGSYDETLKGDYDTKVKEFEWLKKEYGDYKQSATKDMNTLRVNEILKGLDITGVNTVSTNAIIDAVLDGANFEDGDFGYRNDDDSTRFNDSTQQRYRPIDRINELKAGEATKDLFRKPTGGGKEETQGITPRKRILTDNERAEEMRVKLGQTA